MECLIECSKSEIEASQAVEYATRLSIKKIAERAIGEVQKIPTPIKNIIQNKIFFKTSHTHL